MGNRRLNPWIGGEIRNFGGKVSPLICPIDESVVAEIAECGAEVVSAAAGNAHATFLVNRERTSAERAKWLNDAAGELEKSESQILESLIRCIGKPRRAATFEAKRGPQFLRATAAQLAYMGGEVLPLDAMAAGAGRFGFTTRIPYGAVAAITPFDAPVICWCRRSRPRLPWAMPWS